MFPASCILYLQLRLNFLDVFCRPDIYVSGSKHVVQSCENQDGSIPQRRPIHVDHGRVRSHRKKGEDPTEEQEDNSDDVDRQSKSSKVEL